MVEAEVNINLTSVRSTAAKACLIRVYKKFKNENSRNTTFIRILIFRTHLSFKNYSVKQLLESLIEKQKNGLAVLHALYLTTSLLPNDFRTIHNLRNSLLYEISSSFLVDNMVLCRRRRRRRYALLYIFLPSHPPLSFPHAHTI